MTSIATQNQPRGLNDAKRKFFQCQNNYVKYHNKASNDNTSSVSTSCTVYGSAYSPVCNNNKRYVVACTSDGCIVVWDQHSTSNSGALKPIIRYVFFIYQ
jgi:hypothetical protein